jgi:RNA-directed DNA polymerase
LEGSPNRPPEKDPSELRLIVRGRVQHVGRIKGWGSSVYVGLATTLGKLDPSFTPHAIPVPSISDQAVQLFSEGPTDVIHILAAQKYFSAKGEFEEFVLAGASGYEPNGDAQLLKHCKVLAVTKQRLPCVFLFDRDNPAILKEVDDGSGWKSWGNGVVSVVIAPEDGATPACIEMLHSEETRQLEDVNGRRLFLAAEFSENGQHHSGAYTIPNVKERSLVREMVYPLGSTDSVSLSKMGFAMCVSRQEDAFGGIDFEGFRPTFDLILAAVAHAAAEIA